MANPARQEPGASVPLREQQKLYTRRRLLDAARTVFADNGYAASTIDDIVAAAGASRATFYLHFKGKMDVARELERSVTELFDPLWVGLSDMLERGVTRADMAAWIARAFEVYEANRSEIAAVMQAISAEPDMAADVRKISAEPAELLAPYLSLAHAGGADDARLRAAMLIFQHERFAYFWILRGVFDFDRERVIRVFTDVWMEALTGSPSGRSSRRRPRPKRD